MSAKQRAALKKAQAASARKRRGTGKSRPKRKGMSTGKARAKKKQYSRARAAAGLAVALTPAAIAAAGGVIAYRKAKADSARRAKFEKELKASSRKAGRSIVKKAHTRKMTDRAIRRQGSDAWDRMNGRRMGLPTKKHYKVPLRVRGR